MTPTVGRIVQYKLTKYDAEAVNKRRTDAIENGAAHQATGFVAHTGNSVDAGDVYPMLVVRVWSSGGSVNGQVFLDGNDSLWVTSATEGTSERQWHWPEREDA